MNGISEVNKTIESLNDSKNILKIRIVFHKKIYDLSLESSKTVSQLKQEIHSLTSVAPDLQKLILKGKAITKNDETIANSGIKNNDKILLVGSTIFEVSAAITPVDPKQEKSKTTEPVDGIPFCKQSKHKKIIDKGVPEDAMPGLAEGDEPLPLEGVRGMVNKYGKKCRMSFKLDIDELWICSEEKTSKYSIESIESIEDQVIDEHEEYCIVLIEMSSGLQLWFYWVPQQYTRAIRKAIL